jgi:uncharacterized protein
MGRRRLLVLMALMSAVAGCSSSRTKDVYVLNEAVDSPVDAKASVGGPVVQLQRVLVPDYLDTTEIRTRVGPHELRSSSTGRWAERLSLGITHTLLADLAVRLPTDMVMLAGPAEKPARRILVTVETFEAWPDGHCVLAANWTILEGDSRAVLTTGRDTIITPAVAGGKSGDGKVVAGMADAVGRLAGSIAPVAGGDRSSSRAFVPPRP